MRTALAARGALRAGLGAGAPPRWWLSGGVAVANAVAVYQPKGAVSLAASYVNLANPGTYNAAPGIAPTFDAAGWTFAAASSQYLTTNVVPTNQNWSMIVRISDAASGLIFGQRSMGAGLTSHLISSNATGDVVSYRNGGATDVSKAPGLASGTLAMAGNAAYRNGVNEEIALTAFSAEAALGIYLGARNNQGSASVFYSGSIAAFAIYNTTLTATQVAAISAAMALL